MMSRKTEACGETPSLSQISCFPYCPLRLRASFVKAPLMFVLLYTMSHRTDEEVAASFCEDESVLHMALSCMTAS